MREIGGSYQEMADFIKLLACAYRFQRPLGCGIRVLRALAAYKLTILPFDRDLTCCRTPAKPNTEIQLFTNLRVRTSVFPSIRIRQCDHKGNANHHLCQAPRHPIPSLQLSAGSSKFSIDGKRTAKPGKIPPPLCYLIVESAAHHQPRFTVSKCTLQRWRALCRQLTQMCFFRNRAILTMSEGLSAFDGRQHGRWKASRR